MEQKELTEKQKEIIRKIESILKEAQDNKILFLFDSADCSVSAFNGENVEDYYAAYYEKPKEWESKFDWDFAYVLDGFYMEQCNSNIEDVYIVLQ